MPSSRGLPSEATVVLLLRPICGMNLLLRRLDLVCCDCGVRVPSCCAFSKEPDSKCACAMSFLLSELMRKKFLIFCPVVLLPTFWLGLSVNPEKVRLPSPGCPGMVRLCFAAMAVIAGDDSALSSSGLGLRAIGMCCYHVTSKGVR